MSERKFPGALRRIWMTEDNNGCPEPDAIDAELQQVFEAGRQSAGADLAEIGDRLAAALGVTEGNPMALTAKAVEALSVLSGQQGDTSWVLDEMKELAKTAGEPHLFDVVSDQESWNDAMAALHHTVERLRLAVSGQQGVLVPRDVLTKRIEAGHNDTCAQELNAEYECSCGHNALRAAASGVTVEQDRQLSDWTPEDWAARFLMAICDGAETWQAGDGSLTDPLLVGVTEASRVCGEVASSRNLEAAKQRLLRAVEAAGSSAAHVHDADTAYDGTCKNCLPASEVDRG